MCYYDNDRKHKDFNSTMVQLIAFKKLNATNVAFEFQFYYGSINSTISEVVSIIRA